MPGTQLINNGITTGGFGSLALDMSPAINQFVKGQEIEQERRRKVLRQNEDILNSTDISKLSQADLDGGIRQKYEEYRKLGMDSNYKDFNKRDAEMRSAHHSIQNDINTAMNIRKNNMAMYDDLKSLLPPEELIRLQEDIKKPSINSDGTQNVLSPSSYKLKPKDFLSVNKMVYDAIERNTSKSENLKEVRRSDGKFNKLTGSRIDVNNAVSNILEDYKNDHKVRESVDNAVAEFNRQSPTSTPLTPEDYIRNNVESNIVSKQSDRMKELYPDGVFKPGGKEAYINVNPITPNEYVSHTTVKMGADEKSVKKQLGLYQNALDSLGRTIINGGNKDNTASLISKVIKGGILDGNTVTGAEIITKNGQRGIKVIYQDPIMGKLEPKEYWGAQALRQLGVLHNSRVNNPDAIVAPVQSSKAKDVQAKNTARAEVIKAKQAKPKTTAVKKTKTVTQAFKGVPSGGF